MSNGRPVIWSIDVPEGLESKLDRTVLKSYLSQIQLMIRSEDPRKYGKWKQTKYGPAFVSELNKSYRMAYMVYFNTKTIRIIRVGDHKQVYGKD
jgi:mRNA-degrading endonuclease RelE of RelBE toxin-antitoxin system